MDRELSKDKKKPKVILRRNGKRGHDENPSPIQPQESGPAAEEFMTENTALVTALIENPEQMIPVEGESERPVPSPQPALPPLSGFNLDGMSRNQSYILRNLLVFADCAVQSTPEAIFDVLARNFADPGALAWWLWRVGKRDLVARIKRMDIVDAARITAHALHQQLKSEVGVKSPRW